MSTVRVLLVYKQSTLTRLGSEVLEKLMNAGVTDCDRLKSAHNQHHSVLDDVRHAIGNRLVAERWVGDCTKTDCDQVDLVVCVGGDGTVFGVQRWLSNQPLLAVNSDPQRSVGHVTCLTVDAVAATLAAWEADKAQEELLPRLQVCISDKNYPSCGINHPFLNDCLFTNQNPAEMTRYRLENPKGSELQYSSGVWVSTAAGSTAAIASAGFGATYEDHVAALLYLVREPFAQRNHQLTKGTQLPPQGLKLTRRPTGYANLHRRSPLSPPRPPGATAQFTACPHPLRFILP